MFFRQLFVELVSVPGLVDLDLCLNHSLEVAYYSLA
jgi:hypothetical protein